MSIISHYKKASIVLVLFIVIFLPGTSYARSIKDITSTELKEIVRKKGDKILAVTFWATWCKVCQEHLPELSTIYEKYRNKNVEIIGVALDDKAKEVKNFVEEKGIAFPVFRAEDREEMSYIYNIKKIPVVYYYKNGELKHTEEGYTEPKHIEEDLKSCLEGSTPPSKDANSISK
ncbi:MAG: TlpA family protein disulfide reductase [Candidatus Jettenia sp. CY-1]|nr:MAG: TlpA family protein disulfide reductase [Candidatus Jettenia sp. CY-1]